MCKYYVTGVAGMIGSTVARQLLQAGNEVIGLDNFWRGREENLVDLKVFDNFSFRYADLATDSSWSEDLVESDRIIHIADIVAGIGYVFNNEWEIFSQNNKINNMVAAVIREKKPEKVVYLGTACSYPQSMQKSVTDSVLCETDKYPAEPESGYGWSKLIGEIELRLAVKDERTNLIVLDLHNVYGYPCIYKEETSQVIPALIWKALSSKNGSPLDIWGDGSQGRAFVHVTDVANAVVLATQYLGEYDCFMIGPTTCTTIKAVAELVCEHPDIMISDITFDLTKPVGDIGRYADNTLARNELGWSPLIEIREGIFDLIDSIKKSEDQ